MMAYATVDDVQNRIRRTLSETEEVSCEYLLSDAGVIIDAYNADASEDAKLIVSCNMVIRVLGDGDSTFSIPYGATQASMSGLNYSQSFTMGSNSYGDMFLTKLDKRILGVGNAIGSYSPVEELVEDSDD